ncbi:Uncharacterized protein PRO82_000684 [Candidatus Protochlamydia amoebophila]|nr:Uncharacterized protein [Candidatus Protochlamydia amoebophila]
MFQRRLEMNVSQLCCDNGFMDLNISKMCFLFIVKSNLPIWVPSTPFNPFSSIFITSGKRIHMFGF